MSKIKKSSVYWKNQKLILKFLIGAVFVLVIVAFKLHDLPVLFKSGNSATQQVTDEGVTWLTEPKLISQDLHLFTLEPDLDKNDKIQYYNIGKDNGQDIILAILPSIDPSGERHVVLLHDKDTYKLLREHSSQVYNNYSYVGPVFAKNVVEAGEIYHSLLPPKQLEVAGGQLEQIYSTDYLFSDFDFRNKVFQDNSLGNNDQGKHVLTEFTSTPWGPLYSHTITGTYPVQNYVLKLPNSMVLTYQSRPQFVADDNVPLITWNDGTKNKEVFSWNTLGGCGSPGAVMILNSQDTKGLIPIGKTVNNEVVYGAKNLDSGFVKYFYETLPNGAYYFYDSKTGDNKQIPISIQEYNNKHGVFIYKDVFGRYIVFVNQAFGTGAECGKPVIYLYPKSTTPVSVKVGANITVSEPSYVNGWNVVAHSDGSLINSDGKKYHSLFWEGLGHGYYPEISSGFIVRQKDVKKTLWQHVHMLGLNDVEANEFMDFWIPKMPTTPYVRLTWFGTQQMDQLAPLTITPIPDTTIRLFLDFAGLQAPIELQSQVLAEPERKGFTLVEWGGLLRK